MTNKNAKMSQRLLAACMSLLMVLSVIPFSATTALAATTDHPDAVTITVKNEDGNPIKDATVAFTINSAQNGEKYIDKSGTTDENGVVELFAKPDFIADDFTLNAVVNAAQYFEGKIENQIIESDDANYDVILESTELKEVTIEGKTLIYNGEYQNLVSVTPGDYTVTYKIDGGAESNEAKAIDADTYSVEVNVTDGVKSTSKTVTATINKADIEGIDIYPIEGLQYDNGNPMELIGLKGKLLDTDNVTWVVNEGETGSRDIPTASAVGNYTVKLSVDRGSNYNKFEKTVDVEIGLGELNIDGLDIKANDRVYDATKQSPIILISKGDYDLQYRLGTDGDWVTDIDDERIKIQDAGNYEVYVKATKKHYDDKNFPTYPITVTIKKADQTLSFDEIQPETVDVTRAEFVAGKTFNFKATDSEKLANGTVTYAVEVVDGDSDIASIDKNGLLKVSNAGVLKITATLSGNDNYNECSVSRTIQIGEIANAPGELIKFVNNATEYIIGDKNGVPVNTAEKTNKKDKGKVTYSIKEGESYGLSINNSGRITVTDYTKLISAVANANGTIHVTVRADKDKVKNIFGTVKFNANYDTYTLTIKLLATPDVPYTLSETDGTNGWYKNAATVTPADGYTIAKTEVNANADNFFSSVTFDNQGTEARYVYLKNVLGQITGAIPVNIKIDSVIPDANNMSVDIQALNIIEKIGSKFGFYNREVEIKFTVADETANDESGIQKFTWYYTKDDNAVASIMPSKSGELTPILEDGKYVATLKISASELETYRGNISFTATDKAGNESAEKHDKDNVIVVVDKINPVMSADFKLADVNGNYNSVNMNGTVQHYYDGSVDFTFTVKEQNFFSDDVIINVTKGGVSHPVNVSWSTDENNDEVYYGKFTLSGDGDYVVTMSYQDQSKNVMTDENKNKIELYTSDVITIDTKKPTVEIKPDILDENGVGKETQKTIFTVTEHNFRASDVTISGTMKDINGNNIAFTADELTNILRNAEWTQLKDKDGKPTDTYEFEYDGYIDGIYNLTMDYKDISKNDAEPYTADEFTIDHTAPNDVSIDIVTSPLKVILGAITFGFYNPDVEVKFTAYDNVSGVKNFTWNYTKENGASDINRPTDEFLTTEPAVQDEKDKSKFTAVITLPNTEAKELRGFLAVSATDKFENGKDRSNKVTDSGNIIVVDHISPKISVEYSQASRTVEDTKAAYYNGDIDVTFNVTEANFYAEDVKVTVTKNGGTSYSVDDQITWSSRDENDLTVGTMTLPALEDHSGDGHYIIHVEYADKSYNPNAESNNTVTTYTSNVLTIDTIKPVIDVEYQNPNVINTLTDTENHNRDYFDDTQAAIVTITEHNFKADEVNFKIIAKDVAGNELDASALNSKTEWSVDSTGDVHTITITYPGDANYTFDVAYTDLATNATDDYAEDYFTVDKTAPTNLKVDYSTSVLDTVLESLTFGFYNAKMTVTLTADDITSGVHNFKYSYLNAAGVSSVNAELIDQAIDAADIAYSEDGMTATMTFEIPKMVLGTDNQFNGTVEFTAYDRADNETNQKDTKRIVVDNIAPTANVQYNTPVNEVNGVSYYDGDINATVTITEANFYANDVQVMVTKDGGTPYAVTPSWTDNSVDTHTGTFILTEDGDYIITINYRDKSTNQMQTYISNQLTVDTDIQAPTYSINGVAKTDEGGAYKNNATVAFSFEDQNFDTKTIKLERTRFNSVEDVTDDFIHSSDTDKGGSGSFEIPSEVDNDGIYVLTIGMTDKANHTTESKLKFTINRYGSVYEYSDYLTSLLEKQYIKIDGNNSEAVTQDLVITEYNANQILTDSLNILITRDGETIDTKYTSNPTVDSNAGIGDSGWYQYAYTIAKENFAEDGVYKITLTSAYAASDSDRNESTSVPENSIDAAGNQILNTMNFTVDTTKPEIRNIVNLDKPIVNAQTLDVDYTIVDVGGLKSIEVIVNGSTIDTITEFGDSTFNYSGSFTLNESSDAQTVQLKVTDIAGNVTDTASDDFSTNDLYVFNDTITVSTNFFVRWYANKPLFWGSIGGVVVLTGLIWFLIAFKRKKKEDKEEK